MKVPWCEYWEFLDAIVDIETADGLRQFEMYLCRRLKELIDQRVAEQQRQELLQNMSICQLMQLLNLSDSSPSSVPQSCSGQENGVLPQAHDACMTWPPSMAKLLPRDSDTDKVTENSISEEAPGLPSRIPDASELNGCNNTDASTDNLSACSSDSFHTAGDDSDLEFVLASGWPDDWQAVEPLFICG